MTLNFRLEELGWKNFQDLALQIVTKVYDIPINRFADSHDGGRDGSGFIIGFANQRNERKSVVVQSKHTSVGGTLTLALFKDELPKIKALTHKSLCDIYILVTNRRVSGQSEKSIRTRIMKYGVERVLVINKETIDAILAENKRLRGLIPRIYGLGDLSEIIDERVYSQTQEILQSFEPETFVTTQPYFDVIEALSTHRFALLLGEPGSGKSSIIRASAIYAADVWQSSPMWLSQIGKLEAHWNINRSDQLFLLDDVFGTTNADNRLIDGWNRAVPYITAAIDNGSSFIVTSRDYIYNEAKAQLRNYELPVVKESEVVIDVEKLTLDERRQIVYNHLKHGDQTSEFLAEIKPYLNRVTGASSFLPIAAARLGYRIMTEQLDEGDPESLSQFLLQPRQYLYQVIDSLDIRHQKALVMLMAEGGILEARISDEVKNSEVWSRFNLDEHSLGDSLRALDGSMLRLNVEDNERKWEVKHPSVLDALGDWILARENYIDIYIKYTQLEHLMRQVSCGDYVRGSVAIPQSLWGVVFDRFLEKSVASELGIRFFAYRCSSEAITSSEKVEQLRQLVLEHNYSSPLDGDPGVRLFLRLEALGLMEDTDAEHVFHMLEEVALMNFDSYLLGNHQFEGMIMRIDDTGMVWPQLIDQYIAELETRLHPYISSRISKWMGEIGQEYVFADLLDLMRLIEEWLLEDHPIVEEFNEARSRIDSWYRETFIPPSVREHRFMNLLYASFGERSSRRIDIFSDVDA